MEQSVYHMSALARIEPNIIFEWETEAMDMIKGVWSETVDMSKTASTMGSGSLEVYATPALVALMEHAACEAISGMLEEGVTTVGTQMNVSHLAATPVGMTVRAEAVLTAQEGRSYTFAIEAYDAAGLIGKADHQRVAVKIDKFMARAVAKLG